MGFRVIARKEAKRGNDLTYRLPLIVEALTKLRTRSCIIDGEAVSCDADGFASFGRIRYRRHDADVFMWASGNHDFGRFRTVSTRARKGECELGTLAIGKRCQERISATGWAW
jgi:hypothetical protein